MADKTSTAISSGSDLRKNVPVVTVESFFIAHGGKLQLKLEGKRVGFHRKIREPTINRPGRATISGAGRSRPGHRRRARLAVRYGKQNRGRMRIGRRAITLQGSPCSS